MKNSRKDYFDRIVRDSPPTDSFTLLSEMLRNMEDMTLYYRARTKYLKSLLRVQKQIFKQTKN